MGVIKTPFKDAEGKDTVPKRGTGGGTYGSESSLPARTSSPNALPELIYDDTKKSGNPIVDSPFKDAYKK